MTSMGDLMRKFTLPGAPPGRLEQLEERAKDVPHPLNKRARRRAKIANGTRQQRRGQRAYTRGQLEQARQYDVSLGQTKVLAAGPDAPGNAHRYRNVLNSLRAQGVPEETITASIQAYETELARQFDDLLEGKMADLA